MQTVLVRMKSERQALARGGWAMSQSGWNQTSTWEGSITYGYDKCIELVESEIAVHVADEDQLRESIAELTAEMLDWVAGRRSHWNEYNLSEEGSANQAQALCAQHDASEVVKLSAAIQALLAQRGAP